MTTDTTTKHYWAMYEDADKQAQHIDYARFRHYGAADDDEAVDIGHQYAPGWASGFVLYEKDGPGGYSKRRVGVYDVTCEGCGATRHKGNCLPRCGQCGAIATGLTADESDPSVGLFGPPPMCFICDKREQQAYMSDRAQVAESAMSLADVLRFALKYGKD